MLTDLQQSKLSAQFDLLDADGNGFIEWEDYDRVAERMAAGFGHQPGSVPDMRIHDAYTGLWQRLQDRTDTDEDLRVSRDEFIGSVDRAILERADGFDRVVRPVADVELDVCDTDGDGRVSVDEFTMWSDAYGVPRAESLAAFALLDPDGSGFLTRDEIEAAIEDFYVSDDPDAPGNFIFGRI